MLEKQELLKNSIKFIFLSIVLFVGSLCAFGKPYKGAEVYSNQSWKYGKMEMRMKMAKGDGILSTFFTYKNGSEVAGTFWEEIDIEIFGKNNAETFQSNIITGNPKTSSEQVHSPGYSMADNFHTYNLEWTPDYIAWYIDGVEMRRSTGSQVTSLVNSQTFRFNIWASSSTAWVGTFNDAALPVYQYVNWISYSSYTPGAGDNGTDFTYQWRDDFDSFNTSRWSKANWTFDENLCDFSPSNVVVKDGMLILAITKEGQTGFEGSVPLDNGTPTGLEEIALPVNTVSVFPNPFLESTSLIINSNITEKISLEVTDMKGNMIFKSDDAYTNESILIGRNFPPGIFLIKVVSNKSLSYSKMEKVY